MRKGLAAEPWHRRACLWSYDGSSWTRCTPASRSGQIVRDLGLTSNQVWGLAKTDKEWARDLDAALTAVRRKDLRHGANAAYVAGCVCRECREHQSIRMGRDRG